MSVTWGSMDYSSTHYNFVDRPKKSNTQNTVDKAVIRDEIGKLRVYQCHGKTSTIVAKTRNRTDFERKTVGDVMNRLKRNSTISKIVLGG